MLSWVRHWLLEEFLPPFAQAKRHCSEDVANIVLLSPWRKYSLAWFIQCANSTNNIFRCTAQRNNAHCAVTIPSSSMSQSALYAFHPPSPSDHHHCLHPRWSSKQTTVTTPSRSTPKIRRSHTPLCRSVEFSPGTLPWRCMRADLHQKRMSFITETPLTRPR